MVSDDANAQLEQLTVFVNIALEAWESGAAPKISPMGNPPVAGVFDSAAASWGHFGVRRGMRRLLAILDETETAATVMLSGQLCESEPELVRDIRAAGHDICGHGYAQNQVPAAMTPEAEADSVARCTQLITDVAGVAPAGWISPRLTSSAETAALLAEHGYQWHGDANDDDRAYLEQTPRGSLLVIPLTMDVNDLPMAMKYGVTGTGFTAAFVNQLEAALHVPDPPGHVDLTVHAHVGGRADYAAAFKAALLHLKGRTDLRVTTRTEFARHAGSQSGGSR